jgi:hypothetical protein
MQADFNECNECIAVLNQEIELVERVHETQKMVRQAVMSRSWANFEQLMETMQGYGAEFGELERERMEIFAKLAEKTGKNGVIAGDTDFYALVFGLPPMERNILADLYRSLKFKTFKIRVENEAMARYLSEIGTIVSSFLEAAFPDRKGKLYSRSGAPLHADMRSMVLNQHL